MSDSPDSPKPPAPRTAGPFSLAAGRSTSPEVHRERLLVFLREWTCSPEVSKSLRCQFFCLVHLGGEGEREPVTTEEISQRIEEPARIDRCTKVAERIIAAAEAWVAHSVEGRAQKFIVCAYPTSSLEAHPVGQYPFNLDANSGLAMGMTDSEVAGPVGALGQSMRWSENFARMLVTHIDRSQERNERLNDRLLERLEQSEERNMRLAEQREVLLDRAAERQLNVYKTTLGVQREERLYRALEVYGTQLLGKYLGAPNSHPIVGFLQGLDNRQLMAMAQTLPPEKQKELAEVLTSLSAASGQAAARPLPGPAPVIPIDKKTGGG